MTRVPSSLYAACPRLMQHTKYVAGSEHLWPFVNMTNSFVFVARKAYNQYYKIGQIRNFNTFIDLADMFIIESDR